MMVVLGTQWSIDDLATRAPNFDRWPKEVTKHP